MAVLTEYLLNFAYLPLIFTIGMVLVSENRVRKFSEHYNTLKFFLISGIIIAEVGLYFWQHTLINAAVYGVGNLLLQNFIFYSLLISLNFVLTLQNGKYIRTLQELRKLRYHQKQVRTTNITADLPLAS